MSDDEQIGSAADEAAKLFGALSEWARTHTQDLGQGLAAAAAQSVHEIGDHVATDSTECRYCPLCRALHAVRETRPEVKAHLAGAATSFMQAAAGVLQAAAAAAETAVPDPARDGDPRQTGATPGQPVERIDLDDDGEEGADS